MPASDCLRRVRSWCEDASGAIRRMLGSGCRRQRSCGVGPVAAAMVLLIFAGRKAFRRFTTHRPRTAIDLVTLPKVSGSLRACGPRRRLSGVRGCVVAGARVDRPAGPAHSADRS